MLRRLRSSGGTVADYTLAFHLGPRGSCADGRSAIACGSPQCADSTRRFHVPLRRRARTALPIVVHSCGRRPSAQARGRAIVEQTVAAWYLALTFVVLISAIAALVRVPAGKAGIGYFFVGFASSAGDCAAAGPGGRTVGRIETGRPLRSSGDEATVRRRAIRATGDRCGARRAGESREISRDGQAQTWRPPHVLALVFQQLPRCSGLECTPTRPRRCGRAQPARLHRPVSMNSSAARRCAMIHGGGWMMVTRRSRDRRRCNAWRVMGGRRVGELSFSARPCRFWTPSSTSRRWPGCATRRCIRGGRATMVTCGGSAGDTWPRSPR
jgi:hypothetical protein